MKIFRIVTILILVLLSGCKSFDEHQSNADLLEFLSQEEIQDVLTKFKVSLVGLGMQQIINHENTNPNYAAFGRVASPLKEYLILSYTPIDGFVLNFSKAAKRLGKDIADIKLKTEQMISEVTSKNTRLRVLVELP